MYMNDTNWCEGTNSPCKIYFGQDVEKCLMEVDVEGWNRKCPYAGGRAVLKEDEIVRVECKDCCHPDGYCEMNAYQYLNWNGLCAYQPKYYRG